MVRIDEHIAKIEEVDRQLALTKSWKRKNDLMKYRSKLVKQLDEARRFLGIGG